MKYTYFRKFIPLLSLNGVSSNLNQLFVPIVTVTCENFRSIWSGTAELQAKTSIHSYLGHPVQEIIITKRSTTTEFVFSARLILYIEHVKWQQASNCKFLASLPFHFPWKKENNHFSSRKCRSLLTHSSRYFHCSKFLFFTWQICAFYRRIREMLIQNNDSG